MTTKKGSAPDSTDAGRRELPPMTSFARLVIEGQESMMRTMPGAAGLFDGRIPLLTAYVMAISAACSARDKADPGWLA